MQLPSPPPPLLPLEVASAVAKTEAGGGDLFQRYRVEFRPSKLIARLKESKAAAARAKEYSSEDESDERDSAEDERDESNSSEDERDDSDKSDTDADISGTAAAVAAGEDEEMDAVVDKEVINLFVF